MCAFFPAAACGRGDSRPKVKENVLMKSFCAPAVALLIATTGLLAAELKSGLQKDEPAGAFNVKDITGPKAGKSLCYR